MARHALTCRIRRARNHFPALLRGSRWRDRAHRRMNPCCGVTDGGSTRSCMPVGGYGVQGPHHLCLNLLAFHDHVQHGVQITRCAVVPAAGSGLILLQRWSRPPLPLLRRRRRLRFVSARVSPSRRSVGPRKPRNGILAGPNVHSRKPISSPLLSLHHFLLSLLFLGRAGPGSALLLLLLLSQAFPLGTVLLRLLGARQARHPGGLPVDLLYLLGRHGSDRSLVG